MTDANRVNTYCEPAHGLSILSSYLSDTDIAPAPSGRGARLEGEGDDPLETCPSAPDQVLAQIPRTHLTPDTAQLPGVRTIRSSQLPSEPVVSATEPELPMPARAESSDPRPAGTPAPAEISTSM